MFGIKKKGRQAAASVHNAIGDIFKKQNAKFCKKARIEGRAKLANRWAKKHPYKLAIFYGGFAAVLLTLNIVEYYFNSREDKSTETSSMGSLYKVTRRSFESLSMISNNRIQMETAVSELGLKGQRMLQELDSLNRLPSKTHTDSVRMYSIYTTLHKTFNIQ